MTPHAHYLEVERLTFLDHCRTRLSLIRRGLIDDPSGVREDGLIALIQRHQS